jgi:hypothetical protein
MSNSITMPRDDGAVCTTNIDPDHLSMPVALGNKFACFPPDNGRNPRLTLTVSVLSTDGSDTIMVLGLKPYR